MSYGVKNINPLDTTPSVAIGISIPFNSPSVFNQTYITKDAIKNNIINFFLTNKKERYLNTRFGGDLRNFIFEQIADNNIDNLKENIQSQITTNFLNLTVNTFDITTDNDKNTIIISFSYSINNMGINDNITLEFN